VIEVVVLDIEGTISPISFVHEQLFPYSRARVAAWMARPGPQIEGIAAAVRRSVNEERRAVGAAGAPVTNVTTTAGVVAVLQRWIDEDVKAAPLKELQGLIWEEGFSAGHLVSRVYDDVPAALRRWREAGHRLCVYSSGSELAQRLWFTHSQFGDLEALVSGHFDTVSGGPKRDPQSYVAIARTLSTPADRIVFLTDAAAELDAARAAGWRAIGVSRPQDGSPQLPPPVVTSFDGLDFGTAEFPPQENETVAPS
jgi:enolase-phosphatase E1